MTKRPDPPPSLLPSEHSVALFDQARAIRLSAQRLERESHLRSASIVGERASLERIRRELRSIRANLDALQARFGTW